MTPNQHPLVPNTAERVGEVTALHPSFLRPFSVTGPFTAINRETFDEPLNPTN